MNNRKLLFVLSAALLVSWAAHAEDTDGTTSDDTSTSTEETTSTEEQTYYMTLENVSDYWQKDYLTIDKEEQTVTFSYKDSESANAALMWSFSSGVKGYDRLVLDLEEPCDQAVEVTLSTNGFWESGHVHTAYLPAGSTRLIIGLTDTLQYNGSVSTTTDGTTTTYKVTGTVALDSVNLILIRTSWTNKQTIHLRSFYLTNATKKEYYALDTTSGMAYSGATGTTATADSVTFTNSGEGNRWLWKVDAIDSYEYLVIVPRKPWRWHYYADGTSNALTTAYGDPQFIYCLTDINGNTFGGWSLAYGNYQVRHPLVYNLQDKILYNTSDESTSEVITISTYGSLGSVDGIDLDNLASVGCFAETAGTSYGISAIYLTDTKPTYDNRWNYTSNFYHHREYETAGNWGTVCLPVAAAVCGADLYQPTGVDNASNPTTLYVERVYGVMEAGKPYIFQNNCAKSNDQNEGYVRFIQVSATEASAGTNNGLVGSFAESASVPETGAVLSEGTWYKGSGNTIAANRAYLDLTAFTEDATEETKARSIALSLDGNATGISSLVRPTTDDPDAPIYTLTGVRVSSASAPGIYIQNGKKFIVK